MMYKLVDAADRPNSSADTLKQNPSLSIKVDLGANRQLLNNN